jgi:hypothetical protein
MILFVTKYLIPKGYRGLAAFPFIFVKDKEDSQNTVFINHEKIHLRQQLELLVVLFFLWYVLEYLFRLVQYKKAHLAYRNISFEREAYTHEFDLEYLKDRPFFGFLKFVKSNKS